MKNFLDDGFSVHVI